MPEPSQIPLDPALEALAEIANDNMAERLRQEAAARIIVAARRVQALMRRSSRVLTPPRGESVVDTVAAGWDPKVVTAMEYAEILPPRVLDGLLGAAPRWARTMRILLDNGPVRGAAAA
jgi:hypothetical protein